MAHYFNDVPKNLRFFQLKKKRMQKAKYKTCCCCLQRSTLVSKSCLGKIAFFILKTVETGYNTLRVIWGVEREGAGEHSRTPNPWGC